MRTEFRKFLSTRMWWILLVIMVGYMSVMSLGMGAAFSMAVGETGLDITSNVQLQRLVYSICLSMGYVFPAVLGTMSFTGEFRYQTITPTLLSQPNRSLMLGSKMLGAVAIGLVYGLAGTVGCAAGGAIGLSLGHMPTGLDNAVILRSLLGSVIGLALWCVIGVGFGSIVRNQIAAIVILLAFTQLVEPVARIALPMWSWSEGLAKFLPGSAGDAMAGGSIYTSISGIGGSGMSTILNPWQGGLVLLAYAVVFAAIGRVTTLRRDIG